MLFYGIAAAEVPDKVNELIKIDNININNCKKVNDEHQSNLFSSLGALTKVKKIFSEKDCEDDKQKTCFEYAKVPILYVEGDIIDDPAHMNASSAISLLKYTNKYPERGLNVGLSIEGSIDKRDPKNPNILLNTTATGIALTIKPCNTVCRAFIPEELKKSLVNTDELILPDRFMNIIEYTPSIIDTKTKLLSLLNDQLKELYKSLNLYVKIKCCNCGDKAKFLEEKEIINQCMNCGSKYNLKNIIDGINEKNTND